MKTLLQLLTEASARNETELGKMIRGTLFRASPKDLHVNLLVLADFLDEMGSEQASLISQLIRCVTEDEVCGNVYDLFGEIDKSLAKVGYLIGNQGLVSINPPMNHMPLGEVIAPYSYIFDKFSIRETITQTPFGQRPGPVFKISIWAVDNINYQLAFLSFFIIGLVEQKGAVNQSFGSESYYDNLVLKSLNVICRIRSGIYNEENMHIVFRYVNGCIKRGREIPKEVMERMESCLDEYEYNFIVNAIKNKQLIDIDRFFQDNIDV